MRQKFKELLHLQPNVSEWETETISNNTRQILYSSKSFKTKQDSYLENKQPSKHAKEETTPEPTVVNIIFDENASTKSEEDDAEQAIINQCSKQIKVVNIKYLNNDYIIYKSNCPTDDKETFKEALKTTEK